MPFVARVPAAAPLCPRVPTGATFPRAPADISFSGLLRARLALLLAPLPVVLFVAIRVSFATHHSHVRLN
jgi:hypothetical protein